MKRLTIAAVLAIGLIPGLAPSASAEPAFARLLRGQYGYEPSCRACHTEGGGAELGGYGTDFKKAGKSLKAIETIETLDSDHDGVPNFAELKAKANPGSATSKPEKPGDWLDPASLIPAEVRQVYGGITTYKLLDAVFTVAEIERAKALGVELAEADATTIYVPFEGGKAQGAAVIVPAEPDGKRVQIVVAADRDLNLKAAVPIAAKDAPKLDPSVVGKHVDRIDVPSGATPADIALASAVKKGAAMLFVRLTKGGAK